MDEVLSCIKSRRSVRAYTAQKVAREDILRILEAGAWAPSGNNLQPWRFSVVADNGELLEQLAKLTVYENWVKGAPCLIAVFLDTAVNDGNIANSTMKHIQSLGAAIQNMLLAARELGLGTCWIGEILKNEDKARQLLNVPAELQLMAVITVGYPAKDNPEGKRRDIADNIIGWD